MLASIRPDRMSPRPSAKVTSAASPPAHRVADGGSGGSGTATRRQGPAVGIQIRQAFGKVRVIGTERIDLVDAAQKREVVVMLRENPVDVAVRRRIVGAVGVAPADHVEVAGAGIDVGRHAGREFDPVRCPAAGVRAVDHLQRGDTAEVGEHVAFIGRLGRSISGAAEDAADEPDAGEPVPARICRGVAPGQEIGARASIFLRNQHRDVAGLEVLVRELFREKRQTLTGVGGRILRANQPEFRRDLAGAETDVGVVRPDHLGVGVERNLEVVLVPAKDVEADVDFADLRGERKTDRGHRCQRTLEKT